MQLNIYFLTGNIKSKSILALYISKILSLEKKKTLIVEFEEEKAVLCFNNECIQTNTFINKELYELDFKPLFSNVNYIKFDKYFFTIVEKEKAKISNLFNYINKHYANLIIISNDILFEHLKPFFNYDKTFLIYIGFVKNITNKINLQHINNVFLKRYFIFEKINHENLKSIAMLNTLKKIYPYNIVNYFFDCSIHDDELFFIPPNFFNKNNLLVVKQFLQKVNN